ncbi:MAG: hypothetical protein HQM15_10095 [Deltaproteobacteria bacterium]|nr:hypothetical protein [Deltaproteobacteria bacterium]
MSQGVRLSKEAEENNAWLDRFIALLKSISEEDAKKVAGQFESYLEGKISLAQLESIDPKLLNQLAQTGYLYLKSGKYGEAEKIFGVLSFLDSKNVLYQTALASAYHKAAKLDDALAAYTIALEIDPKETSARINRAEILYQLGYFNEPIAELDFALKNPKLERSSWLSRARALKKNITEERDRLKIPKQESRLFEKINRE